MMASGTPKFSWRSEVIGPLAASAAVLGTLVLGFYAARWAGGLAPDLDPGYAVPSHLRRGADLPPPPTSYWVTWCAPPIVVALLGGAGMLFAGRMRWIAFVGVLTFLVGYVPFAVFFVSLDIGGFAPT
ncbi:hypothetical protein [Rhodococcoides corynebacterioides]|uniref:Uncharacterized protein n=1 Tax=Rhodococcoides corynebacterioides TaxID=53972 RepID=A0ABS7P6W9_9NOCA|nr:hypothetical protein [Rhodococcus corynebacterioides]MBY6368138.1 hypothetical protein [Rhodococcus corynebacterioides]MBY6409846.1 hypothetical protein [Rhodococcus corynebacterioides]